MAGQDLMTLIQLQGQDERDNERLLSMIGADNNPGDHAIQIRDHFKNVLQ